jgi:hypothetical protein
MDDSLPDELQNLRTDRAFFDAGDVQKRPKHTLLLMENIMATLR